MDPAKYYSDTRQVPARYYGGTREVPGRYQGGTRAKAVCNCGGLILTNQRPLFNHDLYVIVLSKQQPFLVSSDHLFNMYQYSATSQYSAIS